MVYVDDQHILHYDSETRRQEPRGDWVQGAIGPDFQNMETMYLQGWQDGFKQNLVTLRHHYNQTRGCPVAQLENGEAQPQETSCSWVLPSGDGTYQTWATIEIDSSSNHDYTCSVEHVSLGAALKVAWDKGRMESDLMPTVIMLVILVMATTVTAVTFCNMCWTKPSGPGLRYAHEAPDSESSESCDSTTVFVGQCFKDKSGEESLRTMWLLREEVNSKKDDWKTTRTSSNIFTRIA
ncbi:hypothetical protein Y1Q_0023217 [Alligator mississippiensis]|uniref:MHC class I-like antigen recognition-like domain-containing protein n=1 Tax=Alligator mississippiensis TaxID=8496 RepID=A0A151MZ52_ALLMI|nr:hypothetical protein Y1Q_0023217 [Alligator mississippiensis]